MSSQKRSSSRRRRGGGSAINLILYPLALVGGGYLGVQGYAMAQRTFAPPSKHAAAHAADDDEAPKRATTHKPRHETHRRDEPAERASAERPDEKPGEASVLPEFPAEAPKVDIRPAETGSWEQFPGMEIDRATTGRPEVAVTFDAGSDWKPVRSILEGLAAENVKCTFFLTGEWVQKNPKTARRIASEGHELGNHSWNHPAFTGLKDEEIKDQLTRTESIIRETTGRTSRPYFRPPLGARDARVRRLVGEEGFMTIYWTLDSHDSVEKGITSSQIRDRVLKGIEPGSIVLVHCGSQATADAVPAILAGLKEKGLRPVLLSRLLEK